MSSDRFDCRSSLVSGDDEWGMHDRAFSTREWRNDHDEDEEESQPKPLVRVAQHADPMARARIASLPPMKFEPRTELARRVWELRQRAINAGLPLMTAEEIEAEFSERRGLRDDDSL